jgi:hypothetical protein
VDVPDAGSQGKGGQGSSAAAVVAMIPLAPKRPLFTEVRLLAESNWLLLFCLGIVCGLDALAAGVSAAPSVAYATKWIELISYPSPAHPTRGTSDASIPPVHMDMF